MLAIIVCKRLMTEFQYVSKQTAPSVPYSPGNETMKSIIMCFTKDNVADQLLISAVNRAGLWGLSMKRPVSNLFLSAGRKFREATVGANITSIAISAITNKLLDDLNVRELFSSTLEDFPAYEP